MIIDARSLPGNTELDTDLCIIGAGPAGIALALALAGSPHRVVLMEAGGLHPDAGAPVSHDVLAPGQRIGGVADPILTAQFGGNANAWGVRTGQSWHGVRLGALTPSDFAPTPQRPAGAWPLAPEALDAPLARARALFGLGEAGHAPSAWEDPWSRALPLPADTVTTEVFQFGNGDLFGGCHRQALERAPNITILHHVQALELEADGPAGPGRRARVRSVLAASTPGHRLRIHAEQVAVTAGGLATTRLLLESPQIHPAMNEARESLGRYFMDHPLVAGGELIPASPRLYEAMALYDMRIVRGAPVMGCLRLSDDLLRRAPLLNLSTMLFPRERNHRAHAALSPRQRAGFSAALRLREAALRRCAPRPSDLWQTAKGLDGLLRHGLNQALWPKSHLARGGWSALSHQARRFGSFEMIHQAEQAPHPDNRVTLDTARDALGRRQLRVDWRWHAEDRAATLRGQKIVARALDEAGLGQVLPAGDGDSPLLITASTGHYMGLTRMSESPRDGVVDAQCRVHGCDNLYIGSSSVFPTGGYVNPTLTIVALALRIAEEVGRQLQAPVSAPRLEPEIGTPEEHASSLA